MRATEILLLTDPPKHTRHRMLVNKGFTPRAMRLLEQRIGQLSTRIIDDVIENGQCDFVEAIAARLPLEVISEIMGIPPNDRLQFSQWTSSLTMKDDPEFHPTEDAAIRAQLELFSYINEHREARLKSPTDDIFSQLLHAEVDGERLSELELNVFSMLLIAAGNETTRNALSIGMQALITFPDQRQKLIDNPGVLSTGVEEILRWTSPVMFFRRNVTSDTQVRGVPIKAGDKVALWYISANRDEDAFEDPFRFDVERTVNEHVTFGGGGPHFCLGASLARLEIRALMAEVLRRMADMEIDGEVQRARSNLLNSIKHMPVRFSTGAPEAPRRLDSA
jgi:cholest-4-en-3-one 26-monooxygenase